MAITYVLSGETATPLTAAGRGGAPVMPGQSKTGERKTKKKSRSANLPADYKETEKAAFDKASKSKKTDGGGGGDRSAPPKSKKRSAKDIQYLIPILHDQHPFHLLMFQ